MIIVELGLYIIDEEYLKKYYVKDYPNNKASGERPFFACFQDNECKDIYWIIPISTQVEKYQNVFKKHKNAGVITKLYGKNSSAILTQNIVPIHKKYIQREFLVNNVHYQIKNTQLRKDILRKARFVRALIKNNKMHNSSKIMDLYEKMKTQ